MQQFILRENVLTDNVLLLAEEGKVFKGNYIAIIREYTYSNEWSDKVSVTKFRSKERLSDYINKKYPEFEFTCEVY
jgi:hypothetical protein